MLNFPDFVFGLILVASGWSGGNGIFFVVLKALILVWFDLGIFYLVEAQGHPFAGVFLGGEIPTVTPLFSSSTPCCLKPPSLPLLGCCQSHVAPSLTYPSPLLPFFNLFFLSPPKYAISLPHFFSFLHNHDCLLVESLIRHVDS